MRAYRNSFPYALSFSPLKEGVVVGKYIFERHEKKYVLDVKQYEMLLPYIQANCVPDEYFESNVLSIYYDTPNCQIIRQSIDKPAYKEKLRLRAYGVPKADTTVYCEIKKKVTGVVYKRRIAMKYHDAVDYLENNLPPPKESQITREIDYMKTFYGNLRPSMFISYHRFSYVDKENPEIRVTFDDEVMGRETDLQLDKGIYGKQLIPDGIRLMEVKCIGHMPLWLANALDKCQIFPGSFSKYGNAYKELLAEGYYDFAKVQGTYKKGELNLA